jgi:Fe-S oxidoreductase/nitrate reductase gamma subunit
MWLLIFLILAAAAACGFFAAFRKKLNLIRLGGPDARFDQPGARFGNFAAKVLGQSKMLREPYGIIHFFIFWGFIFICLGEIPFIFEGLFPAYSIPFLGTNPIFFLVKDVLAALVVVGLVIALIRRWVVRPKRLYRTLEALLVVALIMLVVLTEWLSTGAKLALEPVAAYAFDPVYNAVAGLLSGLPAETLSGIRDGVWWLHVLILLGFLVYVPNSKHIHLLAAPFNAYFGSLQPLGGQIKPMDLEDEEATEFGVSRIEAFTWKQLLDSYACGECGRCMDNCPAALSGKPLNPKDLITRTLKHHLLEKGGVMLKHGLKSTGEDAEEALAKIAAESPPDAEILTKSLIRDVVTEDVIWSCTTCMSCQVQCPVSNEHVNKIIDMRRYLVTTEGSFAPELKTTIRNLVYNYNPWGAGWTERAGWAKDLGVRLMSETENPDELEYLFWVGCAGSIDGRAIKVTKALVRIFQSANLRFAILGTEEKCCGEFARRAGSEYHFQLLAGENIETMNGYRVKKIVTACPHCLNTLKNEYPSFGGHYEVVHHTQLISELLKSGRLKLNPEADGAKTRLVYHDSCYLGRYQGEYAAPRELFAKLPGIDLVEMDRHHDRSFCCGAGGGRMWLEEHLGERINNLRAEQALAKTPQAIGANCPYCITMLEDGLKEKLDSEQLVPVYDPAELIAQSLV